MAEWGSEVVWSSGGVRWCGVAEWGSEVVWSSGGVRWCGRVGE